MRAVKPSERLQVLLEQVQADDMKRRIIRGPADQKIDAIVRLLDEQHAEREAEIMATRGDLLERRERE